MEVRRYWVAALQRQERADRFLQIQITSVTSAANLGGLYKENFQILLNFE